MKRLPELRRKVEHARETHTFVVLDPDEADLLVTAAERLYRPLDAPLTEAEQQFIETFGPPAYARNTGADPP